MTEPADRKHAFASRANLALGLRASRRRRTKQATSSRRLVVLVLVADSLGLVGSRRGWLSRLRHGFVRRARSLGLQSSRQDFECMVHGAAGKRTRLAPIENRRKSPNPSVAGLDEAPAEATLESGAIEGTPVPIDALLM